MKLYNTYKNLIVEVASIDNIINSIKNIIVIKKFFTENY